MNAMASQTTAAFRLFTQPFVQAQIKEKKSTLRVTGLCEANSSVCDWWIARTKGQ